MLNSRNLRDLRKNGVFNNNEAFGYDKPTKEPGMDIITLVIGIVVMALVVLLVQGCAYSQTVQKDKAIKAIIGEGENQGYTGMLALAYGIINRGSLKGVYGLNAPRVKKHLYSDQIEAMAITAYYTALDNPHKDITKGANHWENVGDFGRPYWADKCIKTVTIKDHVFFKC